MAAGVRAFEGFGELRVDEFFHFRESAIEINRAHHRLKRIGQGGGAFAAAALFLAAADHQLGADLHRQRLLGQRFLVDHSRPRLGQRALVARGKLAEQLRANHQLQHRIAQKFQPLIVLERLTFFVAHRGMRQRQLQQRGVLEGVPQPFLK